MNTQVAVQELERDLEGNRSFGSQILEAAKAGVEHLRQQVYADLASEVTRLSDTRAGAQLNPNGKPYFGECLNGDDIYIQRRDMEAPQLLIESDHVNKKVQTYYWVESSEYDKKLVGFKREVHNYKDGEIIDSQNEKLSIRTARQQTRLIRKMNQNYQNGTQLDPVHRRPIKSLGTFTKHGKVSGL